MTAAGPTARFSGATTLRRLSPGVAGLEVAFVVESEGGGEKGKQLWVSYEDRPGAAHDTNSIEITASTWRSTSDGSTGSTPVSSRHSGASTKIVATAPVNR